MLMGNAECVTCVYYSAQVYWTLPQEPGKEPLQAALICRLPDKPLHDGNLAQGIVKVL